jgi:hypothetical protein
LTRRSKRLGTGDVLVRAEWDRVTRSMLDGTHSWVREVKFDDYRVQAQKVGSRVILFSRNGHDFTERFPSIARLLHGYLPKQQYSMARSWPAMPMGVRTLPGCTCVGPGPAPSACGRSTCLRPTVVIFVRSRS